MKKWIKETICILFGHTIDNSQIDVGCKFKDGHQIPNMIRFTCSRCGEVKVKKLNSIPYSQPSDKGDKPGQA